MASIAKLPKAELLAVLEAAPQRYWPPRPTRQDKITLVEAINHASFDSQGGERVRKALAAAWKRRREAGYAVC